MKTKIISIFILSILAIALVSAGVVFAVIHVNLTVNVMEPISPNIINISYDNGYSYSGVCSHLINCNNLTINNNANVSYNTNITYEETYSWGPLGIYNTPFEQVLTPGINYVYVCWTAPTCMFNSGVEGYYHITRLS